MHLIHILISQFLIFQPVQHIREMKVKVTFYFSDAILYSKTSNGELLFCAYLRSRDLFPDSKFKHQVLSLLLLLT